jgi:hypothetical protein
VKTHKGRGNLEYVILYERIILNWTLYRVLWCELLSSGQKQGSAMNKVHFWTVKQGIDGVGDRLSVSQEYFGS